MVASLTGLMPFAMRSTAVPVMVMAPPPPPGASMLEPEGASVLPPDGASTFADLSSLPPQAARATTRSEWEKAACLIPHSYYSSGSRITERFWHTLSARMVGFQQLADRRREIVVRAGTDRSSDEVEAADFTRVRDDAVRP